MTLSRWLRDYLYVPLGGNRSGRAATYRNLVITMGLGGLWHGAAWVFVVWGLYQGLGLAIERALSEARGEPDVEFDATDVRIEGSPVSTAAPRSTRGEKIRPRRCRSHRWRCAAFGSAGRHLPFRLCRLGRVLRRHGDRWRDRHRPRRLCCARIGLDAGPELLNPLVAVVIVLTIAVQFVPPLLARQLSAMFSTVPAPAMAIGFALWIMVVVALGPEGVSEFIYFQF